MAKWFRVEVDWGAGFVFESEAHDRTQYLAISDRAYRDGAKGVRVVTCEAVPTEELRSVEGHERDG